MKEILRAPNLNFGLEQAFPVKQPTRHFINFQMKQNGQK